MIHMHESPATPLSLQMTQMSNEIENAREKSFLKTKEQSTQAEKFFK